MISGLSAHLSKIESALAGVNFRCGFASDVVGNWLSEDDQKRKVEFVIETARQLWASPHCGIANLKFHFVDSRREGRQT